MTANNVGFAKFIAALVLGVIAVGSLMNGIDPGPAPEPVAVAKVVTAKVGDRVYFAESARSCSYTEIPTIEARRAHCLGWADPGDYGTVIKVNSRFADRPDLWDYQIQLDKYSSADWFGNKFTVVP
jgi:hypothetical protein